MATEGEWATPRFMGRLLLYKPPLLIWLSAACVRLFGPSEAALRAPALLAAVFATFLLFWWVRRLRSGWAGWVVVLLLVSNPLWNTFARLCYTDMVFVAAVAGALSVILIDPGLLRVRSSVLFVACCGAAVLAKNVAGFLPVVIWLLVLLVRGQEHWPPLSRLVQVGTGILLVILPWHLYQAFLHPQWFWADYVEVQLLGFGLTPPAQSSSESNLWFYGKRLFLTDPFLVLFALISLPALWRELRVRRSVPAVLLVCWIGVTVAALVAFRYRNLPYALGLVPPIALISALYTPFGAWRVPVLLGVFCLKTLMPDTTFSLPLRTPEPIPSIASMREYANMSRPNELIFITPDDEFYSSTLQLPRVRYAFLDPAGTAVRYAPHFAYLGITVTVKQFLEFDDHRNEFAARLYEWGLSSAEPLATTIVARSEQELVRLTESRPNSDFLLPETLMAKVGDSVRETHKVLPTGHGQVFLLAREAYASHIARR